MAGKLTTVGPAANLVVSEVFGCTVQGEGPSLGRRCSFIRFGGCNLHCTWCDTAYTWDASRFDLRAELNRRPVTEIVSRALEGNPDLVVISGGEPLLHQSQPGWRRLLFALNSAGVDVEVETNGTVQPTPPSVARVTRFNVSPKLAHAGDPERARIKPDVLATFAVLASRGAAVFKFVCASAPDVTEAGAIVARHGLPRHAVWIMPEGVTAEQVTANLRVIADPAIATGFNVTTRLHVLAWGTERGR